MTIQILQNGFTALIPSFSVIIILSLAGSGLFLLGRATALKHLIKYHLKEIARDEIESLVAENKSMKRIIEQLDKNNKTFTEALSGIRYILRK